MKKLNVNIKYIIIGLFLIIIFISFSIFQKNEIKNITEKEITNIILKENKGGNKENINEKEIKSYLEINNQLTKEDIKRIAEFKKIKNFI